MSKTIEEWLNTLKEPHRTNALQDCVPSRLNIPSVALHRAVTEMVTWSTASYKGWNKVYDDLMKNPNDPKYVKGKDEVINSYELY